MATAEKIRVDTTHLPIFSTPNLNEDSAKSSSTLLQENHDRWHIFFNDKGFHNHIVHHVLTVYALGGTPEDLRQAFDDNANYQRPHQKVKEDIVQQLGDADGFSRSLGKLTSYDNFLAFFAKEITVKGWQAVVTEYVLSGDKRGDDMLCRLQAGLYHPLIHLSFGIEFAQPSIVAEGLAELACHSNWNSNYFQGAERIARQTVSSSQRGKSIVELLAEIRADDTIRNAPRYDDNVMARDGILARATDPMIQIASQWTCKPEELEFKTAEMINAALYATSAAQRPDKVVKFDFAAMHACTSAVFFPLFLIQDWISTENKCRLLEYKVRGDLLMYAANKAPELQLNEIEHYQSTGQFEIAAGASSDEVWASIFKNVCQMHDDGHVAKLIRSIANGKRVCQPFEEKHPDAFKIRGGTWEKLGQAVMESVQTPGPEWIRGSGFDEAWRDVPSK